MPVGFGDDQGISGLTEASRADRADRGSVRLNRSAERVEVVGRGVCGLTEGEAGRRGGIVHR